MRRTATSCVRGYYGTLLCCNNACYISRSSDKHANCIVLTAAAMKGEAKRKVTQGMEESDDDEEKSQEHRKSEDSEHGKQTADEALRSAKRQRPAPEAAAHQQHLKESKQSAASRKQKDRPAATQLAAITAAQPHHDGHEQKTAAHADAAADTPFAAATTGPVTADPTSVDAAKCGIDPAVRVSKRPHKPPARQGSVAGLKSAVSVKSSGNLDSSKPPKKFKKNDTACATWAFQVWQDDKTAPWGQGLILPEGQRPAEPATEKSPQGFAAVNWGFWQLFRRPDPDAQEEADPEEQDSDDDDDDGGQAAAATAATDEEEEEQDRWYRGVVQWFDKKTKQYWLCMEDGEYIKDQEEKDLLKDVSIGDLIFCIPPTQPQQHDKEDLGHQQQSGQQAAASGQQTKKRKRSGPALQQQQQAGDNAAAAAATGTAAQPAAPLPLVPPAAPGLAASPAGAAAVKEEDETQQQQVGRASQETATDISASAALALVMPAAAAAAAGEHQAEPDLKQEQQQEVQQQQQEPPRQQQQQEKPPKQQQQKQKHKPPAQRKGPKVQSQLKRQQQRNVTSPRGGAPSTNASAAVAAQPPRLAGTPPQLLDLSGLSERPRKLAEQLQKLQAANTMLRRAQQQAISAMKNISEQADADAAGVLAMIKEIRAQLNGQQQQQQQAESAQQKQQKPENAQQKQQQQQGGAQQLPGLGSRLTNMSIVSTWSKDDSLAAQMKAEAARCIEKLGLGGAAADKQGSGAAGNKQASSTTHQQQQGRAGGVGLGRQQQQQQSKAAVTPTKAAVKQEMPSLDKQKYEQEAEAAAQKAEAAAAKIAELQAALKEQQAATAAAEKAATQRSRDLKLLERFHELVPVQLLDNPLRDKAVAMLAALLHPPIAMSPFAMAHQMEALLHEQHGLVGTGKHMYLQHLHFIWNVLGGKELEVAADAALKAEQEALAEGQAEGGRQLSAAEVALRAKAAADVAVAAASAVVGLESGIAGPSAVRGALLEGKLSVMDLFHETAASLGFDQQRDK